MSLEEAVGTKEAIEKVVKAHPVEVSEVHFVYSDPKRNRVALAIQAAAKEYRENGKALFPSGEETPAPPETKTGG